MADTSSQSQANANSSKNAQNSKAATTATTSGPSGNAFDTSSQGNANAPAATASSTTIVAATAPVTTSATAPVTMIDPTSQRTAGQSGPTASPQKSDLPSTAESVSNSSAPPEAAANSGASPVQMAQMMNRAAQTEMRIGLNTSAFGSVEVRTVVHANDVGLSIGSERGDLRSLLSNELPAVANTLQQQNLRLGAVNFHQQGQAFSNQGSSGGDSQPRSFARARSASQAATESASPESTNFEDSPSLAGSSGLSILA